jgi:hypothetical protein
MKELAEKLLNNIRTLVREGHQELDDALKTVEDMKNSAIYQELSRNAKADFNALAGKLKTDYDELKSETVKSVEEVTGAVIKVVENVTNAAVDVTSKVIDDVKDMAKEGRSKAASVRKGSNKTEKKEESDG